MPDKFPPYAPAFSADSIHENARAKAVRASYDFWSTGNEALLVQAFAETFAERAVPLCQPTPNGLRPSRRPGGWKQSRNDRCRNILEEDQRLARKSRVCARTVSGL